MACALASPSPSVCLLSAAGELGPLRSWLTQDSESVGGVSGALSVSLPSRLPTNPLLSETMG